MDVEMNFFKFLSRSATIIYAGFPKDSKEVLKRITAHLLLLVP
jgi:hypothetical protein